VPPSSAEHHWTPDRARLFNHAVQRSDFPALIVQALEPVLPACRTALDVGAGVGALTLPLARRLEAVTALEPAPAMRAELTANVERAGLHNVTCVPAGWGEAELPPHDLVLVANVAPIFDALPAFLEKVDAGARVAVAIVQNVGSGAEKFYLGELYPRLLGRPYTGRSDYRQTVAFLHGLGIHLNVRILEYDFDQPFADFAEALAFWQDRLRLPPGTEAGLAEFLRGKLRPADSGLIAPMRRRSAVLWWTR
jgi:precorrin-6B methylase 2